MDNLLIKMDGLSSPEIAITEEALVSRDALLARASKITVITDGLSKDTALTIKKSLTADYKAVEAARKELKKPVLEIGKRIDVAAKEYHEPIVSEGKRISVLLGDFEGKERVRLAEEEKVRKAKIKEEQDRIREEENKKAAEAKKKEEAALAATEDEGEQERIKAAAAMKAKQDEEDKAKRLAEIKKEHAKLEKVGDTVRLTVMQHFEITNIDALNSFNPEMCQLVVKEKELKAALRAGKTFPGVKGWQTTAGS